MCSPGVAQLEVPPRRRGNRAALAAYSKIALSVHAPQRLARGASNLFIGGNCMSNCGVGS
jgi:hypothetical protein